MLYKLGTTNGKFDTLEPLTFKDFSSFENNEKDLEELIAKSILDVLFEEASLMPVFQERQFQAEADIYALDEQGELIIFELKRSTAGEDAVHQALRYAQKAGQWSYEILQKKYRQYTGKDIDLREAHKEAFGLEHELDAKEINKKQELKIIGSAADDTLISAVEYWKNQGIPIDFLPYRIYELDDDKYFEFFALPYDRHRNPSDTKGVLFDTNRAWDEESIWYMMKNSRVAAWGDTKRFIEFIFPGDIVFFSHKWTGLVAAGRVKRGNVVSLDDEDVKYRGVEFITPVPKPDQDIPAMPFYRVSEITGKNFFWARALKVPYLTKEEAENLANELKAYLEKY